METRAISELTQRISAWAAEPGSSRPAELAPGTIRVISARTNYMPTAAAAYHLCRQLRQKSARFMRH